VQKRLLSKTSQIEIYKKVREHNIIPNENIPFMMHFYQINTTKTIC